MAVINKKAVTNKKKKYRNVTRGIAHIHSTFNNTVVTITEVNGEVLCWKSAGTNGFKGTKKGTPFAAQTAAESAGLEAMKHGVKTVDVRIKGLGSGREAAVRSLQAAGLNVASIEDVTPMPHNGVRARKQRRV